MTERVRPERPSGRAPEAGAGARRPRVSRRVLRGWAYVGGAVTFLVPWGALAAHPRPDDVKGAKPPPQLIEVRRITRRIIVQDPPHARAPSGGPTVRYVYVGGGGGGGGPSTHCSHC